MQTFCFFFVKPARVEGVAEMVAPEERRTFMLDLVEDEDATIGWSSLRIRGPELDRTLAALEPIFGFQPGELSKDLIAGPFPGETPQHVPTFSYIDPLTTRRLAERLEATPEQDERVDKDEEVARVYACFFDALEEAAGRELAVVVDANG